MKTRVLHGAGGATAALLMASFLALAGLAPAVAGAAEEETHVFDATLSLTGDCSTSATDPVPDPGCPGGNHPPSGPFSSPGAVATDAAGDIYVLSSIPEKAYARVDVFDSEGFFLTETSDPSLTQAVNVAADSEGHIYVLADNGRRLVRFDPTAFNPGVGLVTYEDPPVTVAEYEGPSSGLPDLCCPLAVDPANDHLYTAYSYKSQQEAIQEYGSAAEGSPHLDGEIGIGLLERPKRLAVGANHDLYANSSTDLEDPPVIDVFDGEDPEHPLKAVIDGSTLPAGHFKTNAANSVPIAVELATGHLFASDIGAPAAKPPVYEFNEEGGLISTITHRFESMVTNGQIAVDNSTTSPNLNTLYVPSSERIPGHVFAFPPKTEPEPPSVEDLSFDGVTRHEARVGGVLNPNDSPTRYRIEYVTQAQYDAGEFAGATVARSGSLAGGTTPVAVSTTLAGLDAGVHYRFRIVAENECEPEGCLTEAEAEFATYRPPASSAGCPNEAARAAFSSALPDCRAYELVTPADSGGHQLVSPNAGVGGVGPSGTPTASVGGDSVSFTALGGVLPDTDGIGGLGGTGYVARRGGSGWSTESAGPTAAQAVNGSFGGLSRNHRYSTVTVREGGSLSVNGEYLSSYVRYPDGRLELVARGSLGTSPWGTASFISNDGRHIIFNDRSQEGPPDAIPLEPDAPPAGTPALYDRGETGPTHVVSLLPGEVTPGAGEEARFEGASEDGTAVAFTIAGRDPLYLRLDDSRTIEVTSSPGAEFLGFGAGSRYVFYGLAGDLFRYDVEAEATEQITAAGDAVAVNVAAGGGAVYFASPSVLSATANPNGEFAQSEAGRQNLYLWTPASTRFVAGLTDRDVEGVFDGATTYFDGLGLWGQAVAGKPSTDPSRSSRDGAVLVFVARTELTGYDPKASPSAEEGEGEVYRFDAGREELTCLSCGPTLAAPGSSAALVTLRRQEAVPEPVVAQASVANLSASGDRAFFDSEEALVPEDTNGVRDVYEWEAVGTGSCGETAGCVSLISSGKGPRPSFLYGVSESGDDVFISTVDQLATSDIDGTASIYDARVGGGFAEPETPTSCAGEGCRGALPPAPRLRSPASTAQAAAGNFRGTAHRCARNKHRVRRHGRTRCVRKRRNKHRRHAHHRRKHRHRKHGAAKRRAATAGRKGNRK